MYLLAFILPPVAVWASGRKGQAILSIALTALGWLPGVVHAVICVADRRAADREARMLAALRRSGL